MVWCQQTNQQFLIPGTGKKHQTYGCLWFWYVLVGGFNTSEKYQSRLGLLFQPGLFHALSPQKNSEQKPYTTAGTGKGAMVFLVVWGQRLKILWNKQHRTTNVHLNGKNKSVSCAAANEQMLLAKPTDAEELKQSGKAKAALGSTKNSYPQTRADGKGFFFVS